MEEQAPEGVAKVGGHRIDISINLQVTDAF